MATFFAWLLALGLVAVPNAKADIIGIQNQNGSATIDMSQILNGTYTLANIIGGSPSAGSINVLNNTGAPLTSLTLFFNGSLASNAFLNCQSNAAFAGGKASCLIFSPSNVNLGSKTGTGLGAGSYEFVWTLNTSIAAGSTFNINWASFAHTSDTGCIGGVNTANCVPPPSVPEPSSLLLLGTGIVGFATWGRAKLSFRKSKRLWNAEDEELLGLGGFNSDEFIAPILALTTKQPLARAYQG